MNTPEKSQNKSRGPKPSFHKTSSLLITLLAQTTMNLTMRNTFLLLALFVGAVRGAHIDAEVQGVKLDEDYCATSVYDELYAECVMTSTHYSGSPRGFV
jgi:hypothetical protein